MAEQLTFWQARHLETTFMRKIHSLARRLGDDPTLGSLQRAARQEGLVVRVEIEGEEANGG